MRAVYLLFALACICFGQETQTWIQSDSIDDPVDVGRMLEKICPDCENCPEGSAAAGQSWEIRTIFQGHFLSPASEDALVSGNGCESHADGWGGSILLTRAQSSWRQVRYVQGMIAWDCRKLAGTDGRDRLVCGSVDGGHGHFFSNLYVIDPGLEAADGNRVGFLSLEDTTGSLEHLCQYAEIERVTFENLPAKDHVRIVVFARLGQVTVPDSVIARENSGLGPIVKVATVERKYGFTFDGAKVIADKNNPAEKAPQTSYSVPK